MSYNKKHDAMKKAYNSYFHVDIDHEKSIYEKNNGERGFYCEYGDDGTVYVHSIAGVSYIKLDDDQIKKFMEVK